VYEGNRSDGDAELVLPKTRVWPLLLVLGLGAVGVGSLLLWHFLQPVKSRVLVAVDFNGYAWRGSKRAQAIDELVAKRLNELGFETVDDDDDARAVLKDAASPAQAARKLRAAYVVHAKLTPRMIRHEVAKGYFEARVQGPVELIYRDEAPVNAGAVTTYSGAADEQQAVELLGESAAEQVFDAALVALLAHQQLKELVNSGTADGFPLLPAKAYLELREKQLARAAAAYTALTTSRREAEQGGNDITYHGGFDAQSGLVDVGPSGALVFRSKVHPFFIPVRKELGYVRDLDALLWLGFDGVELHVTSAYNIWGYPSVSRDGTTSVVTEDVFGWAKTISVVEAGGEPRRIKIDPAHRFLSLRTSPDGRRVALLDKACDKCDAALAVFELRDGAPAFQTNPAESRIGGFDWLGPDELLVAMTKTPTDPQSEPRQQLYSVRLTGASPSVTVVYEPASGESFGWVRSSRQGTSAVLVRGAEDEKSLARFDLASGKLEAFALPEDPGFPTLSPDGSAAVFEQSGEILHYAFATRTLTQLTRNHVRDRYPMFSPDGKRVYFESIGEDPNFPRSLGVSVIASVKAP
jgi:hypothetical protein